MKKLIVLCLAAAVFFAGCAAKVEADTAQSADGAAAVSGDWNEEWGDQQQEEADFAVSLAEKKHEADIPEPAGGVVEIKEKMFIAQTNDVYLNPEDYMGKTIAYEGIFDFYYDEPGDKTYYYVIRYGPGCCAYDANAGFEVTWNGEYPEQKDWVEAAGVLEVYEEEGNAYLRLDLTRLTVLDERGAEYVSQ